MKLSIADKAAAGDELESEGKVTIDEVASALDARTISEDAGDVAGYSPSFAARLYEDYLTVSEWADITDEAVLAASHAASIFDHANLTAGKGASIFDHSNLTDSKLASIMENANLTLSKLNDIITHDNIGDSHAQERLNATDYVDRDLTGATSILYATHDDWEDNKLTDRDDRATTTASVLGANEFAQRFRPEWTTKEGSPSATGGYMLLDAGEEVKIPSGFDTGTWEQDTWLDAANACQKFKFIWQDADNFWVTYFDDEYTHLDLCKNDAGTSTAVIDYTVDPTLGVWHDIKITRSSAGDWELFYDGSSVGTATDAFMPTVNELRERSKTAASRIDNLEVH